MRRRQSKWRVFGVIAGVAIMAGGIRGYISTVDGILAGALWGIIIGAGIVLAGFSSGLLQRLSDKISNSLGIWY